MRGKSHLCLATLVLMALSARPSSATVIVTCADLGGGVAEFSYDASDETMPVRAFALDITVDNGATIESIFDYKVGLSTAADPGYGIFPGPIVIEPNTGDVVDWGTPVADPCDLPSDTLPGLGTYGITVEMGALYESPEDAPLDSGTLFKIAIDWNDASAVNVNIALNAGRGGIVMEGGSSPTTDLVGCSLGHESSTLFLLDPDGGESLTAGEAYPIKWSSFGSIGDILIEYSTDNGSSWLPVHPNNTGNNGLYNWLVPAEDSSQCLVRVSDANDPNISDASDGVFTIGLPVAGFIVGWGYNGYGQLNVPTDNDFVAIATGGQFKCSAIKSDGSLVGWGSNQSGSLNMPEGNDFVAIADGEIHNVALKSDGSLIAWGDNQVGQCDVPTGNNFVSISTVNHHNVALRCDGSLVGWGRNDYGQTNVPTGTNFTSIATGYWHSLALKTDCTLVAWGDNTYGQLNIPNDSDFMAIAANAFHNIALRTDGSLIGWGSNQFGQCDVPSGNDFVAICAGGRHSLALKSDGSLAAWGRNDDAECDVPKGYNFTAIAAGNAHNLALLEPVVGGHIYWIDLAAFANKWLESSCTDVGWCAGIDINRSGNVDFYDFDWLGQYWERFAPEPNAAGSPDPNDAVSGVSITTDLSWTAGVDTAAHGVYFGTTSPGDFHGYQSATTFEPNILGPNTIYYWQIDEVGLGGATTGDVWSFTTAPAPGQASNPNPTDTETGVSIPTHLSWTAGSDTTSFDVYFGTNPTPDVNEFWGNLWPPSTIWQTGPLDYETTYYWRIDALGPGGTTTGVIWSFTTEAPPVPGQASNPDPTNGEVDVNTLVCLSWIEAPNTTSHDVYFGTSSPPPYVTNQIDTTFCPPNGLEHYTTYYWRIDERNPYNVTTGEEWSFRTDPDPDLVGWWMFNETSGIIAYDSSNKGNHGTLFDGLGAGLVWEPNEGALNFDGSNNLSRVVIPTTGMTTTAGTVAVWANLAEPQNREDGRNGSGYFFGLDDGSIDKILLYMNNSDTQLDMKIGNHLENNITTLSTETWYHIALTWNAGAYAIYVDGSPLDTGTYAGLSSLPSTADIGNNGDSHTQSLHGLVGEVQVYDKALSAEEILQLYQDGPN